MDEEQKKVLFEKLAKAVGVQLLNEAKLRDSITSPTLKQVAQDLINNAQMIGQMEMLYMQMIGERFDYNNPITNCEMSKGNLDKTIKEIFDNKKVIKAYKIPDNKENRI